MGLVACEIRSGETSGIAARMPASTELAKARQWTVKGWGQQFEARLKGLNRFSHPSGCSWVVGATGSLRYQRNYRVTSLRVLQKCLRQYELQFVSLWSIVCLTNGQYQLVRLS